MLGEALSAARLCTDPLRMAQLAEGEDRKREEASQKEAARREKEQKKEKEEEARKKAEERERVVREQAGLVPLLGQKGWLPADFSVGSTIVRREHSHSSSRPKRWRG